MLRLVLPLLFLPATAMAQSACPPAPPPPDPCLVGNWIGTNSALDAFEQAMEAAAAAGVDIDAVPGPPPVLGMTVYEDGFYVTLPFHSSAETYITDRTGTSQLSIDMAVPTQTGHIWGEGSAMFFCDMGSIAPMGLIEGTAPDGTTASGGFTVAPGGSTFEPDMTYSCEGDLWTFTVQLPAPIGNVDYVLHKFPDEMFSEEFRSFLEDSIGR